MKHNSTINTIGASLLALALLFGAATTVVHAQTTATTTPGQSTTTPPVISSVSAVSSTDGTNATISWLTDVNATSQVAFGSTSAYTASTTASTTLVTNHSVTIGSLVPSTTYHFAAISRDTFGNVAMSPDMTFTTNSIATTTPPPVTGGLQDQINALRAAIVALQARVDALFAIVSNLQGNNGNNGGNNGNNGGNNNNGGLTSGGTAQSGATTLVPASASVPAGNPAIIDWNGRNFGHEETVGITLNGSPIGSAHADGGGNFTTGSISIPTSAGTYTYTFTGRNSGISLSSTVTVH